MRPACWLALILAGSLGTACRRATVISAPPPAVRPAGPAPISTWPVTLAAATRAADAGDYAMADRLLLEHSVRHPGTPEGAESDFWRALFRADPSHREPSTRERIALLDAYLAVGASVPRFAEATVLRRLLESTDSLAAALQTVRTNSDQRLRTREEEFRRLTDELDRTAAELERIKKRLAPGKPPAG